MKLYIPLFIAALIFISGCAGEGYRDGYSRGLSDGIFIGYSDGCDEFNQTYVEGEGCQTYAEYCPECQPPPPPEEAEAEIAPPPLGYPTNPQPEPPPTILVKIPDGEELCPDTSVNYCEAHANITGCYRMLPCPEPSPYYRYDEYCLMNETKFVGCKGGYTWCSSGNKLMGTVPHLVHPNNCNEKSPDSSEIICKGEWRQVVCGEGHFVSITQDNASCYNCMEATQ